MQRTDSREVISWSGQPIACRNEEGQSRVVQSNGRPLSRSATAREERDNGQVLESSWLEGNREVVNNDVVVLQVYQQRLHSRTKPRGQDEKGAVAGTTD